MGELLTAALVVFLVGIAMVLGSAAVAVLAVRRTWRGVRRRALALWSGNPRDVSGTRLTWAATRARREMWRDVRTATQAVNRATAAQAPVGDLVHLARRLNQAATEVDHALVVAGAGSGPVPPSVSAQVRDVCTAARHLHAGAVGVVTDVSLPTTRALLQDVDAETQALSTGMARWRAISHLD